MSDSSIIEARLGALENRLSEVQARLQKTESTQPFKIEAGSVSIEEAPIKNAAINAASDECITANREAIVENATSAQLPLAENDIPDSCAEKFIKITSQRAKECWSKGFI